MTLGIVTDRKEKKEIIEVCDAAFHKGIVSRDNYDMIFNKLDQYAIIIGAYDENEIIGYAAMYANDLKTKTAYISMIGVIPKMQGKHIGSNLMKRCVRIAKEAGMKFIRLEVENTNQTAIKFYKHNGFSFEKKCSQNTSYYLKCIL